MRILNSLVDLSHSCAGLMAQSFPTAGSLKAGSLYVRIQHHTLRSAKVLDIEQMFAELY